MTGHVRRSRVPDFLRVHELPLLNPQVNRLALQLMSMPCPWQTTLSCLSRQVCLSGDRIHPLRPSHPRNWMSEAKKLSQGCIQSGLLLDSCVKASWLKGALQFLTTDA